VYTSRRYRDSTIPNALAPFPTALAPPIPSICTSLVSSAFGVRDCHGIEPLSLPPEGDFDTLEDLLDTAQTHARLAGYAVVEGPKGQKNTSKGGRWTKFLICRHSKRYEDRRGIDQENKLRPNRGSKKTNCPMRMKIQERPDGS
jgi:hypothetical protein